jgi:hypothetical protein
MTAPKAMVTIARYGPLARSASKATTVPAAAATRQPKSTARGNGKPSRIPDSAAPYAPRA